MFSQIYGSRFLDFRVTDESTSGEVWISHTFLAQPLEPVLKSIKQFIMETEKELVILQVWIEQTMLSTHTWSILSMGIDIGKEILQMIELSQHQILAFHTTELDLFRIVTD